MTTLKVPLKLNGVVIGTAEVDPDAGTVTGHITHPDAARRLFHQALEQLSLSIGPAEASLVVNHHRHPDLLALPESLEQYRRERDGTRPDPTPPSVEGGKS